MREPKSPFRVLTESGPLVALTVAVALLVGIAGPASAQFVNFGGWSQPQPRGGGGGWFGGDIYAPFQPPVPRYRAPRRQAPRQILEDFSKAPTPEKRETVPERRIWCLVTPWMLAGFVRQLLLLCGQRSDRISPGIALVSLLRTFKTSPLC